MEINQHSENHHSDRNIPLFHTFFIPQDEKIRGTLLIIHGMQEHSGRYEEIAQYFTRKGFVVLTYDHPGHGHSIETEEDFGFFQKRHPGERLMSGAQTMSNILKERYPNLPHFVLGHSMGSFVTRCLLQKCGADFSGAVIVGTGGRLPGIGLLKAYFALGNWLTPRKRGGFNTLFSIINNRRFRKEVGDKGHSWLSLNPENREAFATDRLCGIPFTNNGFLGLFSVYQQATEKGWWKAIPKSLSFLFVSGEEDPIGDFGKGVKQSAEDLKKHGFKNIKVNLYPKMRHEILNEDLRLEILQMLVAWMGDRIEK